MPVFNFQHTTIKSRFSDCGGVSTGFDYLRLCLALLVIAYHSIVICYGLAYERALVSGYPLRGFAFSLLPAFFALSGFLVAGSLVRAKSIISFLSFRAIRIFPALCFEILMWAALFGPLLTSFTLREYYSDKQFYEYFLNIFGIMRFQLPGMFMDNPSPNVVNRQLWTIPFELDCYILLAGLAMLGVVKRRVLILIPIVIGILYRPFTNLVLGIPLDHHILPTGNLLVLCFLAGVAFHLFQDRIILNRWLFAASLISSYFLLHYDVTKYFAVLTVTYATVYIGCLKPKKMPYIFSGDYSYGLFLYGFPIQQAVAMLLPEMRIWGYNFLISLFFAVLMAMLSWNLVEKPIGKRKKDIAKFIQSWFGRMIDPLLQKVRSLPGIQIVLPGLGG